MRGERIPWPHAPTHQLAAGGTFFLTAATYLKLHYFREVQRLDVLERGLLKLAAENEWRIEAWAVFSNHYHFIAHSPDRTNGAANLVHWIKDLHTKTAEWINRIDGTPRRRVWYNYRETLLTRQYSYLSRLKYVHENPVKHGLVPVANQYRWGSAAWFERTASPAQVNTIYRFKTDTVEIPDDYSPVPAG